MDKADDTQYHVTLCHPMRIKLIGCTVAIVGFDGVMNNSLDVLWSFSSDCVYIDVSGDRLASVRRPIRTLLLVPFHNISGLVAQPFEKKA